MTNFPRPVFSFFVVCVKMIVTSKLTIVREITIRYCVFLGLLARRLSGQKSLECKPDAVSI